MWGYGVIMRMGMEMNVFGEWVDENESPTVPPPVRVIEVTEEIRAADTAARMARDAQIASTWSGKALLSMDNLRRKAPVAAQTRPVRAVSAERHCERCKVVLSHRYPCTVCRECRQRESRAAVAAARCSVASVAVKPIAAAASVRAESAGVVCVYPGCGRTFRPCRKTIGRPGADMCTVCRRRAVPQVCVTSGCGATFRRSPVNAQDGLCTRCRTRARGTTRYRREMEEGAGKRCSECSKAIARQSTTGLCRKCFSAARAIKTVLRSATPHERAADRQWAQLSCENKWALLERLVNHEGVAAE